MEPLCTRHTSVLMKEEVIFIGEQHQSLKGLEFIFINYNVITLYLLHKTGLISTNSYSTTFPTCFIVTHESS